MCWMMKGDCFIWRVGKLLRSWRKKKTMIKLENLVCAIRKSPSSLKYHLTHFAFLTLESSSSSSTFQNSSNILNDFYGFFHRRLIIVMQCSLFSVSVYEKPYFRSFSVNVIFADDAFSFQREKSASNIFYNIKKFSSDPNSTRKFLIHEKSPENYAILYFFWKARDDNEK